MAVEKRIGIEIRIRSVFILILVLLYAGRLGAAAPLLSADFPIWSVITVVYRSLSQAISFLILAAMSLDTSFSRELMPLDFLVDLIPFLLIFFSLVSSGLPKDDAQGHETFDSRWPVSRTLVKFLLGVLAISFFPWGVGLTFQSPSQPINSPEALREVFPFWSAVPLYAQSLPPFELLRKFTFYSAMLIVGLIGNRGALAFQEKNNFVSVIIMLPFTFLVIWSGIFAFPLIPAFFIQLGNFADPALPWFERFAATLQAWLAAAGR